MTLTNPKLLPNWNIHLATHDTSCTVTTLETKRCTTHWINQSNYLSDQKVKKMSIDKEQCMKVTKIATNHHSIKTSLHILFHI